MLYILYALYLNIVYALSFLSKPFNLGINYHFSSLQV